MRSNIWKAVIHQRAAEISGSASLEQGNPRSGLSFVPTIHGLFVYLPVSSVGQAKNTLISNISPESRSQPVPKNRSHFSDLSISLIISARKLRATKIPRISVSGYRIRSKCLAALKCLPVVRRSSNKAMLAGSGRAACSSK